MITISVSMLRPKISFTAAPPARAAAARGYVRASASGWKARFWSSPTICPSTMRITRWQRPPHARVVRDDHERLQVRLVQLLNQVHDLAGVDAVQVAGRFVAPDDRRLVDQRPGDRHPLPLPARQLRRPVPRPVRQPHPRQRRLAPLAGHALAPTPLTSSGSSTFSIDESTGSRL